MSILIPDQLAMAKKQKELENLALSFLPLNEEKRLEIAKSLTDSFIELTPPLVDSRIFEMRMLTMTSQGLNGGQTKKLGNIYLNFENLLKLAPDIILTIYGTSGPTWILFFVALHIWNTITQEATIEIDQNHAMAIYAMWNSKDSNNKISEETALNTTNSHLQKFEMRSISKSEFSIIINNLIKLECIELTNGIIWLKESVKTNY